MASIPSNIFSSGTFSSLESHVFRSFVFCGVSPLYVRTLLFFRASAWKVFSVSLYR